MTEKCERDQQLCEIILNPQVSVINTLDHGLSQQGVWVPFWTPKPLKRTPQHTQIFLCGISKNPNLKLIIEFFHLLIIPMTLFNDIVPYFDEFIHVYGWNMSILWSHLKIWMPKIFTTANFRHPVSKSWLGHYLGSSHLFLEKLTPLMLLAAKSSLTILMRSCREMHSWKDIWWRNVNQNLSNKLHQIFCKNILNSLVFYV